MHSISRLAPRAASAASAAVLRRFQPLALAMRLSPHHRVAQPNTALLISRAFSFTARGANAEEPNAEEPVGTAPRTHAEHEDNRADDPSAHGVFVRNLSFDANEQHLKEIFDKFGTILETKIVRDPRGLSRGYGFVFFDNEESMSRAISTVNGSFWHGRRIMCNPRISNSRDPRPSPSPVGPTTSLYIGNIPYETTDAELNRLFRDMENVKDVRVAVDRVTGWPRGFAHADFTDVESAEKAYNKLQGVTMGQRELRIDFATRRPRGPA